jgi:hypothetical protein
MRTRVVRPSGGEISQLLLISKQRSSGNRRAETKSDTTDVWAPSRVRVANTRDRIGTTTLHLRKIQEKKLKTEQNALDPVHRRLSCASLSWISSWIQAGGPWMPE